MPFKQYYEVGQIIHSNHCGDCIVLDEYMEKPRNHLVKVKFIDTGYIGIYHIYACQNGSMKDPYFRSVCSIGYLGHHYPNIDKLVYKIWNDMISRCYNPKEFSYKSYGALGVRVCNRWHSYSNFADDIVNLPGYNDWIADPKNIQFDKDYFQQNVPTSRKVYSPRTCCFLPRVDNAHISRIEQANRRGLPLGIRFADLGYSANVYANGVKNYLGRFDDPYAAAAFRNAYIKVNNINTPLSETNMSFDEAMRHKTSSKRIMCKIVNKNI